MWVCIRARSANVRVIGPEVPCGIVSPPGASGTRPCGGLNPYRPLKLAGMRMDPPMSLPVASVVSPAASAAPDPPDDPPVVKRRFHGLRMTPHSFDQVTATK